MSREYVGIVSKSNVYQSNVWRNSYFIYTDDYEEFVCDISLFAPIELSVVSAIIAEPAVRSRHAMLQVLIRRNASERWHARLEHNEEHRAQRIRRHAWREAIGKLRRARFLPFLVLCDHLIGTSVNWQATGFWCRLCRFDPCCPSQNVPVVELVDTQSSGGCTIHYRVRVRISPWTPRKSTLTYSSIHH